MLIEAFLRERPVVAMGVGGIRDVVDDGVNGLLVSSDEELADALVRVLTDRRARGAARRRSAAVGRALGREPGRVRRSASPSWCSAVHWCRMTAQQAKQVVKNALYRTIGETSTDAPARRRTGQRTLRVLMYHKVNDIPENPTTVPVARFDEQLAAARASSATRSSTSTRCSTTTRVGDAAARRAPC